jgi:hypothetical protein
MKCYVWSIALYGAETWTLQADQKHLSQKLNTAAFQISNKMYVSEEVIWERFNTV